MAPVMTIEDKLWLEEQDDLETITTTEDLIEYNREGRVMELCKETGGVGE